MRDFISNRFPTHEENKQRVALAFSAGGVKGASAHGAMIALFEYDAFRNCEIVAISGNSAGAWNGVAIADGLGQTKPNLAIGIEKQRQIWEAVKQDGSMQTLTRHALNPFAGQNGTLSPLEIMLAFQAGHTIDALASATKGLGIIKSTNDNNADRVERLIDFDAVNTSSVGFYTATLEKMSDSTLVEVITANGQHSPQTIADASAYLSPNQRNGRVFIDAGINKAANIQVMEKHSFDRLLAFGEGLPSHQRLHPIHQSEKVRQDGLPHAATVMPHHLAFLSGHKNYAISFIDFPPLDDESIRMNYTGQNVDRLMVEGYSKALLMIREFGSDLSQWPTFDNHQYAPDISIETSDHELHA